ncbi:MAG: metallophosphoesterase [Phycisphaerales bacterium]
MIHAMSSQELISVLLFLLAILTICGLEIAILVRSIGNRLRGLFARKILFAKPSIVVHGIALSIFACLLYAYFIEPYWIDVHSATLRTARLKSDSFRIVQISDLHCDRTARNEERVVQIINSLKPDIVVATGDYLNDLAGLPRLRQMLSRLEAPLGKFAVTGNFEALHWPNVDVLADSGFRVLERETVVVTQGADALAITGMGFVRSDSPREPLEGFSEDRYDVFLFHTPDLVEDFAHRGIDLYLCGHTHGGQVRLPWYGALVTLSNFGKKYESGLYRVGDTVLYVNRGLGLEPRPAPQVRFLARPEIAVFDILPE